MSRPRSTVVEEPVEPDLPDEVERRDRDPVEILEFAKQFCRALGVKLTRDGRAYRMELPPELHEQFGRDQLSFALNAQDAWVANAEILAPGSFLLEKMYETIEGRGRHALFLMPQPRKVTSPAEVRRAVGQRLRLTGGRAGSASSLELYTTRIGVDFKVAYQTDELEEELLRVVEEPDGSYRTEEVAPESPWKGTGPAGDEVSGKLSIPALPERYEEALAEARKAALARGRSIEKRALRRLAENLARLRGYFAQIRSEVSGDGKKRASRLTELEREEQLKTDEEIDTHRVRVRIQPIALSLLAVPTRRVKVPIRDTEAELIFDWDLSTNRMELQGFGEVGKSGIDLAVCHRVHPVLQEEATACEECETQVCAEHRTTCPGCEGVLCVDCGETCQLCERRFGSKHGPAPCGVCERGACAECSDDCSTCERRVCRDHTAQCTVCGDRVCTEHAIPCGCGAVVCQRDLLVDEVSQIRYCGACAIRCSDCDGPISRATSSICKKCGGRLCHRDALHCEECGDTKAPLCGEHRTRCNCCGGNRCPRHRKRCRVCARDQCADCLDTAGRCRLCIDIHRSRRPLRQAPRLKGAMDMSSFGEWHRKRGSEFDIFLGRRPEGSVLVVADKDGAIVKSVRS